MERLALGTKLKLGAGDGPPETFNPVADLREFDAPTITVDSEETTNHSQVDYFRKYKPTLIDPGEASGSIFFDPSEATHDDVSGILSFLSGRTENNFKIDFPTDPVQTWAFSGVVTGFQPEAPLDEHLKGSFTIKLSDSITISNAAIVNAVDDTGADGPSYVTAETIEVSVTFDKTVNVNTTGGTPSLILTLGSGNVTLNYASGDGTNTLVFNYVVQGGDSATAGEFVIAAQSIALNGGTIKDDNENDVRLSFTANEVADVSDRTVN